VSEFAKKGSYPLNTDVLSEDFISGKILTTVTAIMSVDPAPWEEALTSVMNGMTLAPEESLTAAEEASLLR
jgi:hypothetical protein